MLHVDSRSDFFDVKGEMLCSVCDNCATALTKLAKCCELQISFAIESQCLVSRMILSLSLVTEMMSLLLVHNSAAKGAGVLDATLHRTIPGTRVCDAALDQTIPGFGAVALRSTY